MSKKKQNNLISYFKYKQLFENDREMPTKNNVYYY